MEFQVFDSDNWHMKEFKMPLADIIGDKVDELNRGIDCFSDNKKVTGIDC